MPATSAKVIFFAFVSANTLALLLPMLSTPGPPEPMRIMKKFHSANISSRGSTHETMPPRRLLGSTPV